MTRTLPTLWDQIGAHWPANSHDRAWPYGELAEAAHAFLAGQGVNPVGLSHYGIVVADRNAALARLNRLTQEPWRPTTEAWVEAFNVHVMRGDLQGVELEFIEPDGPSFFADFLAGQGERLQHISFRVDGIHEAVKRLRDAAVPLVNDQVREGSHGWIAFLRPDPFTPLCLELCQPK